MNPSRCDQLSKVFAQKGSRRSALCAGGLGLTGLVLASPAFAQQATPVATPGAKPASWLFVMTFQEATVTLSPPLPASGRLILRKVDPHVLTFADRPAREWTLTPVEDMARDIDQQQIPYNAVLGGLTVADATPRLWVVVLLTAEWDADSGQLTCDIEVIGEHTDASDQADDDSTEVRLGTGYVFIDSKNNGLLGPG